jgi:hypothetical protein
MHRSGTSAVCGALQAIGVSFGDAKDHLPADQWNESGYYENRDVFLLNAYAVTGARRLPRIWFTAFEERTTLQRLLMLPVKARYISMPDVSVCSRRLEGAKEEAERIVRSVGSGAVKDPRFCLLIGAWSRITRVEKVLFCLRHPAEVVASLRRRDGMPRSVAYRFWSYHISAFLRQQDASNFDVTYVDVESLFDPSLQELEARRLFRFGGREFDPELCRRVLASTIEARLRHHRDTSATLPPNVAALWAELNRRHDADSECESGAS